ncbi:unnamed protein product [Amoebophrya sp. A120]|nr:unnamed protein product [Amoebophrya sp. A120]|eukprot:GSA120T00001160001.1
MATRPPEAKAKPRHPRARPQPQVATPPADVELRDSKDSLARPDALGGASGQLPAEQQEESLLEELEDGVVGFFNRMFGAGVASPSDAANEDASNAIQSPTTFVDGKTDARSPVGDRSPAAASSRSESVGKKGRRNRGVAGEEELQAKFFTEQEGREQRTDAEQQLVDHNREDGPLLMSSRQPSYSPDRELQENNSYGFVASGGTSTAVQRGRRAGGIKANALVQQGLLNESSSSAVELEQHDSVSEDVVSKSGQAGRGRARDKVDQPRGKLWTRSKLPQQRGYDNTTTSQSPLMFPAAQQRGHQQELLYSGKPKQPQQVLFQRSKAAQLERMLREANSLISSSATGGSDRENLRDLASVLMSSYHEEDEQEADHDADDRTGARGHLLQPHQKFWSSSNERTNAKTKAKLELLKLNLEARDRAYDTQFEKAIGNLKEVLMTQGQIFQESLDAAKEQHKLREEGLAQELQVKSEETAKLQLELEQKGRQLADSQAQHKELELRYAALWKQFESAQDVLLAQTGGRVVYQGERKTADKVSSSRSPKKKKKSTNKKSGYSSTSSSSGRDEYKKQKRTSPETQSAKKKSRNKRRTAEQSNVIREYFQRWIDIVAHKAATSRRRGVGDEERTSTIVPPSLTSFTTIGTPQQLRHTTTRYDESDSDSSSLAAFAGSFRNPKNSTTFERDQAKARMLAAEAAQSKLFKGPSSSVRASDGSRYRKDNGGRSRSRDNYEGQRLEKMTGGAQQTGSTRREQVEAAARVRSSTTSRTSSVKQIERELENEKLGIVSAASREPKLKAADKVVEKGNFVYSASSRLENAERDRSRTDDKDQNHQNSTSSTTQLDRLRGPQASSVQRDGGRTMVVSVPTRSPSPNVRAQDRENARSFLQAMRTTSTERTSGPS